MTHRDVIDLWPTHGELAALLGVKRNTVSMMYKADRIAPQHWLAIVEAKPEVTLQDLARHVQKRME